MKTIYYIILVVDCCCITSSWYLQSTKHNQTSLCNKHVMNTIGFIYQVLPRPAIFHCFAESVKINSKLQIPHQWQVAKTPNCFQHQQRLEIIGLNTIGLTHWTFFACRCLHLSQFLGLFLLSFLECLIIFLQEIKVKLIVS